jgi:hypothetical protein
MIQAAVDELESLRDDVEDEVASDAKGIASELSEVISSVEGLEFPGMYG